MPRLLSGFPLTLCVVLLSACGGGGGGSGSGSGSGKGLVSSDFSELKAYYNSERKKAYSGRTHSARLDADNSQAFAQLVTVNISNPDALAQLSTRSLSYSEKSSDKSAIEPRRSIDETESCENGGKMDAKGDINDDGVGALSIVFRDCEQGGAVFNGEGALYFHSGDDRVTQFYDGVSVATSAGVEIITGSFDFYDYYYDDQHNSSASKIVISALFASENNTHMVENLALVDPISSNGEFVKGRVYVPAYGYADVNTRIGYQHDYDKYLPVAGDIGIVGENTSGYLFFDDPVSRFYFDSDGDSVQELAANVLFDDMTARVDLGDFVAADEINAPPVVGSLRFFNTSVNTFNDIRVSSPWVSDYENDPVDITYEWRINGGDPLLASGDTLPAGTHQKGDTVSVRAVANDGHNNGYSQLISLDVGDAPGQLVVVDMADSVEVGDLISFQVAYADPDPGDAADAEYSYRLISGPDGMSVSDDGEVTWTASNILFGTSQLFHFSVGVDGDQELIIDGVVNVKDSEARIPLARSGLAVPLNTESIWVGDFDGQSGNEILLTDSFTRVMLLSEQGGEYKQSWLYPFSFGNSDRVHSVKSVDLNDDGVQEPLVVGFHGLYWINDTESAATEKYQLDGDRVIKAAVVANLDADPAPEIALIINQESYPYSDAELRIVDLESDEVIWSNALLGDPRSLAVGNVDEDAALELVVSNGYVFDVATKQNEWYYSQGFGDLVALADLDGNGIREIVGSGPELTFQAHDAFAKEGLWTDSTNRVCSLVAENIDDDPQDELVLGACGWSDIAAFDASTGSPVQEWSVAPGGYTIRSIAYADADNDGVNELIWGAGAGSSDTGTLVVADLDTEPFDIWQSDGIHMRDFVAAGWGQISPEDEKAVFVNNEVRGGTPYITGPRIITMGLDGELEISVEFGNGSSESNAAELADYNNDGYVDLALPVSGVPRGVVDVVRVHDDLVQWTSSPGDNFEEPSHLIFAPLNNDEYKDLIYVDTDRVVMVDVQNQTMIWQSGALQRIYDIAWGSLDGDQPVLLTATYNQLTLWESSGDDYTSSVSVDAKCEVLLIQNVDSAGDSEIICAGSRFFSDPYDVVTYDSSLNELSRFQVDGRIMEMISDSENGMGDSVIVSINNQDRFSSSYRQSFGRIASLSLARETMVWSSPQLPGYLKLQSLYKEHVEGRDRLIFATNKAMYITR